MYNSSLKVLLIEDNPGDARLIRETLRETKTTQYEMEWVDRLSPGLRQLARDAIDIVLLDLSLPDSYGSETLERTLSHSKEVPIVVLTGLDDEELAIQALRNGAQDYLIKSDVNSTLLGRSIRHAIERKRAEVALQKAHDTLEERVRERTDAFVMQNKKLLKEIEERRQAENLYQTLAEKSMAGVYIVQDKIFRYLNSNAAAYAGYTPEELTGREACCIVHPEDRKGVKLRARQMLKGERDAPYKFRIRRRDGHERWILETITSTVYEGKPAILGNSMDVTDMKKAGENVRESHQLLSNIISFLPDATLIIDQNGTVLAWNRAMEELTGVKAEDMVGLDNYEYSIPFYGERRPILIDLALKADGNIENKYSFIQKGKDLLVAETNAPCVRGENLILWGKAAPIRNTNGEIVGAIETIRDTTKRKQMEDSLRESEIKYRELVQNANSIIYRRDTEGNVTFFNEYAQGFFGYSEDEILGKNVVGTLVPEVDSAGNDLTAMIADISAAPDRYVINENENMRSNGERVWIAWTNKALRDENGAIQEILCIGTDMTERRVMQGKLQESENWYRTLFETTGAGTVIIDEDTTLSLVNNEFETMTGYRKEELIGESWTKVIAGDDLERMKQYHDMRRTDPKAVPSNYECTLVDRHGAQKNILINVSMIPGTKKSIASFLDITEQRRLARELQESLREYRLLADNVSDIIWTVGTDLRFTYISPSVKRLRGYSVEEALNQTLDEILTPASLEIAMKTFTEQRAIEAMEDKDPTRTKKLELEHTCKDGSTIWCEVNMTGLRDSDGRVYGILGVNRDITERKRIEKDRWETEHRYHILFDHSPMGVFHYDNDFRVIDCNEAAASILRTPREDVVGFDLKNLEDRSVIPALTAPLEGNEDTFEGFYKTTATRSELWMSLRTAPLYSRDGTIDGGVAIMEDISDRIRANQALEASKEALEIKTRSLEETNTALGVLFDQVEKNRQQLQWNVLYNVKQLILPYIEKLRAYRTDSDHDTCLQVLETNLNNIISPFMRQMTLTHYKLTPKEFHVANLVKEGKTNKEIADMLHLSIRSVEFHRENIREKLGLKNKKLNLRSFLLSLE